MLLANEPTPELMNNTMSIYVAGHRGLIGSAICRRLKREGYNHLLIRTRAEIDLTHREPVDAFFDAHAPKIVILSAGRVGGIIENRNHPADFIVENLDIQRNVLCAAHRSKAEKVIFFGSSCMYPRDCSQPMAEEQLLSGKLEETSIAYAISKLAGVHVCLSYNRQYGIRRFIPIIPNNVYGPNDDFNLASSHVLSALIKKIHEAKEKRERKVVLWGTGNPRREFIHADDVADACLFLLRQDISQIELPINIGVGQDYSIRELAEMVMKVVGFNGNTEWDTGKPDGAPRKLLDSSRIRSLGWRPKITLEEGIYSTYEWFLNNRSEVKDDSI